MKQLIKIYSKNTDESLDEYRRVQTNVDESQTNVDEGRGVQTFYQTSVDECRRITRRVQANIDQCRRIKNFFFDSKKNDTWSHFVVVAITQQQARSLCEFSSLWFYQ